MPEPCLTPDQLSGTLPQGPETHALGHGPAEARHTSRALRGFDLLRKPCTFASFAMQSFTDAMNGPQTS